MKRIKKSRIVKAVSAVLLILAAIFLIRDKWQPERAPKIVFLPKVKDETNDFWMSIISGGHSAAKEFDAELIVLAPDIETDYELQEKYVEEAIKLNADAVVISPILYEEMTDTVRKVKEAGIKLVMMDSNLDESLEDCYVATNNVEAGIKMGEKILDFIEEDSKIVIMSHVKDSSTAMEREQGLRQGLGPYEKNIVEVLYANSDYEQAYQLTKELLKRRSDITLIAGTNLYSTVGVGRAVREMQLEDRVQIVGFDNDVAGIQYMEEGIIDTLIVQNPFNMGYLSVQKAVELVRGHKVEPIIYSDTEVITLENIYDKENQKLLFPF